MTRARKKRAPGPYDRCARIKPDTCIDILADHGPRGGKCQRCSCERFLETKLFTREARD